MNLRLLIIHSNVAVSAKKITIPSLIMVLVLTASQANQNLNHLKSSVYPAKTNAQKALDLTRKHAHVNHSLNASLDVMNQRLEIILLKYVDASLKKITKRSSHMILAPTAFRIHPLRLKEFVDKISAQVTTLSIKKHALALLQATAEYYALPISLASIH